MKIKSILGVYESNTFVVEHNDTTVIVDAGAPVKAVLKALEKRKVDMILLTHEHFDHTFYIADYAETFGCSIVCHSAALQELIHKNNLENTFFGEVETPENLSHLYPISKDKAEIKAGKISITPFVTPGHSAGSVVYLIEDCLFTGDVLFRNSIGRTDFMENGEELMQESLKKIRNIKFTSAYHGHGKASSYEEQQRNINNFIE